MPLLIGVIGAVLLQGILSETLGSLVGGGVILLMGFLSLWLTPREVRQANDFNWHPIIEVAILFLGIFITMVPALAIMAANRDAFQVRDPWQYFWITGLLSAFLDNAPTYLTFATTVAGQPDFANLASDNPLLLQAISCGAVFMGALT